MKETTLLFRPVEQKELDLIQASGFTTFPPRLPGQPIFYPILNEECAIQIARDWNAKRDMQKVGYVTRFHVSREYLRRYEIRTSAALFTKSIGYQQKTWRSSIATSLVKSK